MSARPRLGSRQTSCDPAGLSITTPSKGDSRRSPRAIARVQRTNLECPAKQPPLKAENDGAQGRRGTAVSEWPQHLWEDRRRPVRWSATGRSAVASKSLGNTATGSRVPEFGRRLRRRPREEEDAAGSFVLPVPQGRRGVWAHPVSTGRRRAGNLVRRFLLGRRSHRRVPRAAFWEDRRHGYLFTGRRRPRGRPTRSSSG